MDKQKFDGITRCVTVEGCSVKYASTHNKVSERTVERVLEAGSWERWPYIMAKARFGYQTPEYKAHLKRKGLPITPPAKKQIIHKGRTPGMTVYNATKPGRVRKAPEHRNTLSGFKLFYEDVKNKIKGVGNAKGKKNNRS